MSAVALRFWVSAIIALGTVCPLGAQTHDPIPSDEEVAALAARYAQISESSLPPSPAQPPAARAIQPVAYDAPSVAQGPPLPAPPAVTFVPQAANAPIYPSPQTADEVIIPPSSDAWCIPPGPPARTSSWTAALELIPSYPRVTDGQFGRWSNESSVAARVILGYEDPQGLGIRARFWGLSHEAETQADDIELEMGQFTLDLYKRIFLDHGELAIGAGPASGAVEFKLSDNTHSDFEGAGGTVFIDGYYGLIYFDKSELGAVTRARYSILLGDWRDTTGGLIIPRTDNDTMAVTELAWGLEYRRRFGPCEDHNWFVGLLADYQRWQSDWMSNLAGTSIGVSGVNIYAGLNW